MSETGTEHSDTKGVNNSVIELMREMLEEILLKSSVDSLLNHKLVSRLWYNLICGQDFINLHKKYSNNNTRYIICRVTEDFSGTEVCLMDNGGEFTTIFTLPEFIQGQFLRVVNSFNGLLLITCDVPNNDLLILTCNPATRRIHLFPKGSASAVQPTVGIAFNLENSQYKVFRFFKDLVESEEDSYYACEVYTPLTGYWRRIQSVRYRPLVTDYSSCNNHVCVDGTVYYLGCPDKDQAATGPACIMAVNMINENFKKIVFPGCLELTQMSFLINLEEKLSLVTVDCPYWPFMCPGMPDFPTQAHLWVAEDLSQPTWFLKTSFKIHVDGIYTFKSVVACKSDILFIFAAVEEVLHYHIFHVADSSWTILDLTQNGYHPSQLEWPVAFPFAESLCPCGGDKGFFTLIPNAREIEEMKAAQREKEEEVLNDVDACNK